MKFGWRVGSALAGVSLLACACGAPRQPSAASSLAGTLPRPAADRGSPPQSPPRSVQSSPATPPASVVTPGTAAWKSLPPIGDPDAANRCRDAVVLIDQAEPARLAAGFDITRAAAVQWAESFGLAGTQKLAHARVSTLMMCYTETAQPPQVLAPGSVFYPSVFEMGAIPAAGPLTGVFSAFVAAPRPPLSPDATSPNHLPTPTGFMNVDQARATYVNIVAPVNDTVQALLVGLRGSSTAPELLSLWTSQRSATQSAWQQLGLGPANAFGDELELEDALSRLSARSDEHDVPYTWESYESALRPVRTAAAKVRADLGLPPLIGEQVA